MTLRITRLEAENVLRIIAVDAKIGEDGRVTRIIGGNAHGKTSFLTALALPFLPTNKFPDNIIRRGAQTAKIKLEIRDDVDALKGYDAFMKFVRDPDTDEALPAELEVRTQKGVKVTGSAGTFLRKLYGPMSISLSRFLDLHPEKQFQEIAHLVKFDLDIKEWEKERKKLEDERRDLNVAAGEKEKTLKTIPYHPDAPDDLIDTDEVLADIETAQDQHQHCDRLFNDVQRTSEDAARTGDRVQEIKNQIARLEKELEETSGAFNELNDKHDEMLIEAQKTKDDLPDIDTYKQKLNTAETVNTRVRENEAFETFKVDAEDLRMSHAEAHARFLGHKAKLADALGKIEFPIPGMHISEDLVLMLGESTFQQASHAEQLKVALTLEFMRSRELPFVIIEEGSIFDPESHKMIEELAEEFGFQVIIEEVQHSDGQQGIIIKDGMIAGVVAA